MIKTKYFEKKILKQELKLSKNDNLSNPNLSECNYLKEMKFKLQNLRNKHFAIK